MNKALVTPILVLSGIIAIGGVQVVRADTNLVTNGGFESGTLSGWTASGNALAKTYPSFTQVGQTALMGNGAGGSYEFESGPYGSQGFIAQALATTAGTTYTLSFDLKNVGGVPPGMQTVMNEFDVSWGAPASPQTNLASFDWTQYTYDFTATDSTTNLTFGFQNNLGCFYLDNVNVAPQGQQQISVPDSGSTVALLGVAMLGLGALRRKLAW